MVLKKSDDNKSLGRQSIIFKLDKLIEGINASSLQLINNYKKRKKSELSTDDKKLLNYLLSDIKESIKIIKNSISVEEEDANIFDFEVLPNFLKQANVYYSKFKKSENLSEDINNLRKLYLELNNIKSSCNKLMLGYWGNFKKNSNSNIVIKNYNLMISFDNKNSMAYLLDSESSGGNAGTLEDGRTCKGARFLGLKRTGEILAFTNYLKDFLKENKNYDENLGFQGLFRVASGEYNEIIECYISSGPINLLDRPFEESKLISQTAKEVLRKTISLYNKNSISKYNKRLNLEKGILFRIKKFFRGY